MTSLLPVPLHRLACSVVVQALFATATIAIVSASSAVLMADPASLPSSPTTLATR